MPTLIRPKAKPKDKPTRTANFWGIRYRCPHRNRSWVISTFCNQKANAERRLREFAGLLERGGVGRENPFKQQRDDQRQRTQRLDVGECLRAFEQDLRAGRIRKRGKRTPVGGERADTTHEARETRRALALLDLDVGEPALKGIVRPPVGSVSGPAPPSPRPPRPGRATHGL